MDMGYKNKIVIDNFGDKIIYLFDLGDLTKRSQTHYYQAFHEGGYYGFNEDHLKNI